MSVATQIEPVSQKEQEASICTLSAAYILSAAYTPVSSLYPVSSLHPCQQLTQQQLTPCQQLTQQQLTPSQQPTPCQQLTPSQQLIPSQQLTPLSVDYISVSSSVLCKLSWNLQRTSHSMSSVIIILWHFQGIH